MRKRLMNERKSRNWTQQYIAERLGITVRAYQYYEHGDRDPQKDTIDKLEDLFGISQRELLVRDCTPNSETA